MSTTPDPNALPRQAGESDYQFKCRQQQANPPTTGPAQRMAAGWLDLCAGSTRAPSGFDIK